MSYSTDPSRESRMNLASAEGQNGRGDPTGPDGAMALMRVHRRQLHGNQSTQPAVLHGTKSG